MLAMTMPLYMWIFGVAAFIAACVLEYRHRKRKRANEQRETSSHE